MKKRKKIIAKEASKMVTYYKKERDMYLELMQKYIENFENMPQEEKESYAQKSLEEAGVLTKNGNLRKLCKE
ncbi:MAG: hypothetical protein VZR54_04685 [Ruminococcus sp.]|nr:hypothetical protein [Ruminococcus sp.]